MMKIASNPNWISTDYNEFLRIAAIKENLTSLEKGNHFWRDQSRDRRPWGKSEEEFGKVQIEAEWFCAWICSQLPIKEEKKSSNL